MTVLGYGLAILIGLSLGLLGGGGSILAVPILVYVLGFGMKQAVPMSLAVVGITSVFGALSHHRNKNIRWDAALVFGPAAIAGAFAGARLAGYFTGRAQLMIFAILMLAAAVSMFAGPSLWMPSGESRGTRRAWPVIALLGSGVGMMTGLVGVGGGFLYVPALVLLGGLPMKEAVGTSLVLIIMSCVAGFVSYLGVVELDWRAIGLFTTLAVVGVLIGSRLVAKVSQGSLRKAFAVFLLVMGVLVLLKPR